MIIPFSALASTDCPGSHCANIGFAYNKFCMKISLAGQSSLLVGPGGEACYCPCSCVSSDTKVLLEGGLELPFFRLSEADKPVSPFRFETKNSGHLMSNPVKNYPAYLVRFRNGKLIQDIHNHTLIEPNMKSVKVSELSNGQVIVAAVGENVSVISIDPRISYTGEMQNMVVNKTSIRPLDHLIVTNGLVSGDFLLQARSDTLKRSIDLRLDNLEVFDIQTEN